MYGFSAKSSIPRLNILGLLIRWILKTMILSMLFKKIRTFLQTRLREEWCLIHFEMVKNCLIIWPASNWKNSTQRAKSRILSISKESKHYSSCGSFFIEIFPAKNQIIYIFVKRASRFSNPILLLRVQGLKKGVFQCSKCRYIVGAKLSIPSAVKTQMNLVLCCLWADWARKLSILVWECTKCTFRMNT